MDLSDQLATYRIATINFGRIEIKQAGHLDRRNAIDGPGAASSREIFENSLQRIYGQKMQNGSNFRLATSSSEVRPT